MREITAGMNQISTAFSPVDFHAFLSLDSWPEDIYCIGNPFPLRCTGVVCVSDAGLDLYLLAGAQQMCRIPDALLPIWCWTTTDVIEWEKKNPIFWRQGVSTSHLDDKHTPPSFVHSSLKAWERQKPFAITSSDVRFAKGSFIEPVRKSESFGQSTYPVIGCIELNCSKEPIRWNESDFPTLLTSRLLHHLIGFGKVPLIGVWSFLLSVIWRRACL